MKGNTLKLIFRSGFFILIFLSLLLLLMPSCKKGDTGVAGKDGAANVVYSEWFTPTTYIKDTVFGIWGFKFNKAAPDITQNMLDSGTIITYGKLLGYNQLAWPVNQVAPLPITLTYIAGSTTTDTWHAFASVGNLRIRFANDKNIYPTIANTHQFRYIIIPPGKKATLGIRRTGNDPISAIMTVSEMSVRRVAKDHSHMTYQDVCRSLSIPE